MGLTNKGASRRVGVHDRTGREWRNGRTDPKLRRAPVLATGTVLVELATAATGCTVHYLSSRMSAGVMPPRKAATTSRIQRARYSSTNPEHGVRARSAHGDGCLGRADVVWSEVRPVPQRADTMSSFQRNSRVTGGGCVTSLGSHLEVLPGVTSRGSARSMSVSFDVTGSPWEGMRCVFVASEGGRRTGLLLPWCADEYDTGAPAGPRARRGEGCLASRGRPRP